MDLIDQTNKLIKVRIEEFENKTRNKKDHYYSLSADIYFSYFNYSANTTYLMKVNDQLDSSKMNFRK